MSTRTKYRFPGSQGRKDAEIALARSERDARYLFWFAAALADGRIAWTRKRGDYRFASFIAVPHGYMRTSLTVVEFLPRGQVQMPQYHIMDSDACREEYARRLDLKDENWIAGAEALSAEGAKVAYVELHIADIDIIAE